MAEKSCSSFYVISIIFLALGFAFIHMYHVSTLFENDRHFSHLSNLEREMTFRTEMGFYYHYYKVIVNAKSFQEGINGLLQDNRTEYPEVINAVKRFNLYPEILIGGLFRVFDSITKKFDFQTRQCWEVSRGPSLPPVNSCEGLGDPIYFYLEFIWYCAGLSKAILFLYAMLISESLTGGLLTILSFLYNHGHCTRVQWTPPLRESFAYPFCLLQMLTVTYFLKKSTEQSLTMLRTVFQVWFIMMATASAIVLWQFSQFVIATQAAAVLLMFSLGMIQRNVALSVTFAQMIGLLQAAVILFGNELLFQSILFSLLLAILFVILSCDNRISYFSARGILVLSAVAGLTLTIKTEVNQFYGNYDAHIFDILRSKLTNFKNFHTMLYTCSPEFDFLPASTIKDMTKTGLIPVAVIVITILLYKWGKAVNNFWRKNTLNLEKLIEPYIVYNVLQLGAFSVMAGFIMRLKLFWTPHLCLIVSLVMSTKYFPSRNTSKYTLLALLIAVMSYEGIGNVIKQRNIMGEYANLPFEEVLNWINSETLSTDVFAGPMSIMANVLLSTGRKIVNHPHYEHPRVRDRTLKVYSIFSRQSPEEVYSRLIDMGVDYVILDESWCFSRSRDNCSMIDLWDLTDVANRNREALCPKLFRGNSSPFIRAFSNEIFVILSLKARQFIEITPIQQYSI